MRRTTVLECVMRELRLLAVLGAVLGATLGVAACGGGSPAAGAAADTSAADTGGIETASAGAPLADRPMPAEHDGTVDTVVFGADRWAARDSAYRTLAAREPDRALLEQLLDQYEGLGFLTDVVAQQRESDIRGRAWRHDKREDREAARLAAVLASEFRERYEPVVADEYRHRADSILHLDAAAQERAFVAAVVDTHRRSVALIDSLRPSLRHPATRAAVTRLRDALGREIAQLTGRPGP